MTKKGSLWTQEEMQALREHWQQTDLSPKQRGIAAAHALGRPVEGTLSKAREMGLPMVWGDSRGHSGQSVGPVGMDHFKLPSNEARWKEAWLKAHGRRSYGAQEIRV
jgi:hypothetical protein